MRLLEIGTDFKEKSKFFAKNLVIIAMCTHQCRHQSQEVLYIAIIRLKWRIIFISRIDSFILNNLVNELLQKYG